MMKNIFGFGDFDLFFKVFAGLKTAKFEPKGACAAQYLMNQLVYFNQICMDITFGHDKKLNRFW